jgi:transcription initiation factor TFIID subunit 1
MKGGFKAIGESVEDKLSAKKRKELGGHSYNVAEQTQAYQSAIRRIWDAQTRSLSTIIEHSDTEMDIDEVEDRGESLPRGMTPHSEAQTPSVAPAASRRRDDETMSQFSKFSTESRSGRVLRITRKVRNEDGEIETREELVRDQKVIHQYLKRKHRQQVEGIDFKRIKSSDVENNPLVRKQLEAELGRLERNKDRRLTREKQKAGAAGSPDGPASPGGSATPSKPTGTQRKCANCGQVGHIKTNKKLCPLLNGTMKQEDGFGDSSFSMGGSGI